MFKADLIPSHCNMIAIVALADSSVALHNYHFLVLGTIRTLNKSNMYDIVLLPIITVLCIRAPDLPYPLVASMHPEITSLTFSHA